MATNNAINNLGADIKVTTFTSGGTWTKDLKAKWVRVHLWSGGGGGGSGRRGATGAAGGGSGAGNGQVVVIEGAAPFFDATESITIGAGGAGGAAQTSDNTDGNDGVQGGGSAFGDLTVAQSNKGLGGTTGTANGGGRSDSHTNIMVLNTLLDGVGAAGKNTAGDGAPTVNGSATGEAFMIPYTASGGGGGGGADSGTTYNGGTGGAKQFLRTSQGGEILGGTAGISDGADGGDGADSTTGSGFLTGGSGAGGGGGMSITAPSNGGDGGIAGGAGGGGGGSLNGTNSGAGGTGGVGQVVVLEWLGV